LTTTFIPALALVLPRLATPGVAGALAALVSTLALDFASDFAADFAADLAPALPRTAAAGETIDLFQRWAWDLLALRRSGRVRYHRKQRETLARLAAAISESRLLAWMDSLKQARATADHPLNTRLLVEGLLSEYVSCLRSNEAAPTPALT